MINALPPESATKTALRNAAPVAGEGEGPDASEGQWSQAELLLASVYDAIRHLEWVLISVKGGKTKPPEQMPRPGVEPKAKSAGRRQKSPRERQAVADAVLARINGAPLNGTWISAPPSRDTRRGNRPPS